jgi:hypothetical protein
MAQNPIQQNPETEQQKKPGGSSQVERVSYSVPEKYVRYISPDQWNLFTDRQREILNNIDEVPEELIGVVPESVWESLELDKKLEFIFSHDIVPRFEVNHSQTPEDVGFDGEELYEVSKPEAQVESPEERDHESHDEIERSMEKAAAEVREIENRYEDEEIIEQELSNREDLPPESIQPDSVDQTTEYVPTFVGYNPSDQVIQNISAHQEDAPQEATAWISTLFTKLRDALNFSE